MRKRTLCRHCHKKNINRPLGLCWGCYYTPGVRALYPSTSKFANKGGDSYTASRLDAAPTQHGPGQQSKIDVMQRRVSEGLSPFHPEDPGWEVNAESPPDEGHNFKGTLKPGVVPEKGKYKKRKHSAGWHNEGKK